MKTAKTRTRYKIIGSDFSAQEPRLTSFMSQDPNMMQAYKEGKDLYCVIAANMFNNKYEENLEFYPEGTEIELDGKKIICGNKTHLHKAGKERRSAAKTMLLAILYGMGAGTAGARMGKTAKEGQELMDNFFKAFPRVKKLIEDSKEFLREHGYVEDWAGRRRHLPDLFLPPYEAKYKDEDKMLKQCFNPIIGCQNRPLNDSKLNDYVFRASQTKNNKAFDELAREALKDGVILQANTGRIAQAERQCLNARIQGGAASLTKLAMVKVHNDPQLREWLAKLIITVHDEVLVECPAYYADQVEERLPKIMIDTAKPFINVPMKCDPYNVTRWYCDEAAVSVQEEFKKFEAGNKDKGIPPMSREDAFKAVYKKHPELTKECIDNTIIKGDNLEW